jgi:oxygen-independent coproporphyrinogen-3 oxidase
MNPRTLTPEKLALLRSHGVTRASLGVQAWDEPTLRILGRDHSPEEGREAFQMLREAKFQAVSIDLMFAIPTQSIQAWSHSLETSISLQPDHISCYNLTYEEDTDYFEKFSRGDYVRDEGVDESFFREAMQRLGAAGFEQYEISNHARPGYYSEHNRAYWRGADYLGLGPSAVSTIDRVRSKNVPDTGSYISKLTDGESIATEVENLTQDQWLCERLALELRTREGISLEYLPGKSQKIAELAEGGLVQISNDRVRLTTVGKLVADSVIGHLWL